MRSYPFCLRSNPLYRWEDSPLVTAAKEGKIVVLDGIHRLSPDTLSVLQRLVQERELDLYDGSTLRPYDQHQQMTLETGEVRELFTGLLMRFRSSRFNLRTTLFVPRAWLTITFSHPPLCRGWLSFSPLLHRAADSLDRNDESWHS